MSSPAHSLRDAQGVGSVLKATGRLLAAHWLLTLKIIFGIFFPALLLGGGLLGAGGALFETMSSPGERLALTAVAAASVLIGVIVVMVGALVSGTGVLAIPRLDEEADAVTFANAWTLAKEHVTGILGVALLTAGAYLGVAALAFGLAIVLDAGVGLGALIGFIAVLTCLFLLFRGFMLAQGVVVIEGRSTLDAVSRAFSLGKGAFWQTTGIFVSLALLQMVGSQILQFPIRLMSSPAALLETAPWLLVPLLGYALLAFAAGILISTAISFAAVVQTYALKERSDAPFQQSS